MPNPWHDEIGRFAPKGTGSRSDGGGPLPWMTPQPKAAPSNVRIHKGDDAGRASFKDKVKRKLHELVDQFMEGLDEDLGSANWDPVGLVPYSTKRRGRRGKLVDQWAAILERAIREIE